MYSEYTTENGKKMVSGLEKLRNALLSGYRYQIIKEIDYMTSNVTLKWDRM
jgi:hypothetical protein